MPGVLAQLLPLGRLPGSLAQLLPLGRLPGSLAQLLPLGRLPGSLARLTLKKFLRFLNSQELFSRKANRDPQRLFSLRNLA